MKKYSTWAFKALRFNFKSSHEIRDVASVDIFHKFNQAKKHFDACQSRLALPLLEEIETSFNQNEITSLPEELKELIAKTKYLIAEISANRSSDPDDSKALKRVEEALVLKPDFKEAIELRKSLLMDNYFFKDEDETDSSTKKLQ